MRRRFKGASVDATEAGGEVASTEAGDEPERWASGRKADVVLRLLRGEDESAVSREIGVPALSGHLLRRTHRLRATHTMIRIGPVGGPLQADAPRRRVHWTVQKGVFPPQQPSSQQQPHPFDTPHAQT